ncbi:THUMP domain-containing protein 3-like isoform X1 [Denticeps clupeoides]|uniref:THUMP domain-containing protein n=1 Tax=Denticeps clupeoides TaxID=299321 RepID=A0AAY4CN41_9TELE|nr:THUMP domain-containing protein 3-like isoform X1 [Denticeps clupeoides]XP_028855370.1 THUMP domain-containing protein 3-like isoform X1 [Denticeps clupeoides]
MAAVLEGSEVHMSTEERGGSGPDPGAGVTIGATVPTGFEPTAAEEVGEKIGAEARIGKDRGRIYFRIGADKLPLVHRLRSVDNLFVVVAEYNNYQFKESKEETLLDLQKLASQLPWTIALEVWKMNNALKKKRGRRRGGNSSVLTPKGDVSKEGDTEADSPRPEDEEGRDEDGGGCAPAERDAADKPLKFRVTCNRAGDKHSFTSNDAARDFGGAVQEFFQWKADMTKFDIEVLLNIHNQELVVGIALTEESLHRRNITHFGPTTLRSTLAYGMLRLCRPQISDVIVDPMCGTGAIPVEGAIEWQQSFFIAGDNNDMAVNRTVNNTNHILKRRQEGGSSAPGLRMDTARWDLCRLPLRASSVDIIVTDMPFGKRMGSRKKNWDLYPSCLREMARVCRPATGKAVLLTQDKKCFAKVTVHVLVPEPPVFSWSGRLVGHVPRGAGLPRLCLCGQAGRGRWSRARSKPRDGGVARDARNSRIV